VFQFTKLKTQSSELKQMHGRTQAITYRLVLYFNSQ